MSLANQALIGFGQVRHTRLAPVHHSFCYRSFFLMLPLRSLSAQGSGALARNRFAPLSFYDTDHGDGRADALAWLEDLLHGADIHDADGEIWLHCYPRVWGYAFKPVSFWHCERADGSLRALVVEVNNTFGERHCYLLEPARYGVEMTANKVFHVSPFCHVEGHYRFRFMRAQRTGQAPRSVARIDYDNHNGALLQTSVSGELLPLTAASVRRALWRYPAQSLMVIARIHWQAAKLWLKRVPFISKPAAPEQFLTR